MLNNRFFRNNQVILRTTLNRSIALTINRLSRHLFRGQRPRQLFLILNSTNLLKSLLLIDRPILPLTLTINTRQHIRQNIKTQRTTIRQSSFTIRRTRLNNSLTSLIKIRITFLRNNSLTLNLTRIRRRLLLHNNHTRLRRQPQTRSMFLSQNTSPPRNMNHRTRTLFKLRLLSHLRRTSVTLKSRLTSQRTMTTMTRNSLNCRTRITNSRLINHLQVLVLFPTLNRRRLFILTRRQRLTSLNRMAQRTTIQQRRQ